MRAHAPAADVSQAPATSVTTVEPTIPSGLLFLLALVTGSIAANLYYSQPLVDPIAHALHIPLELAGFIVTLTQIGYGVGLVLLVPLADRQENRTLIITLMVMAAGCLFTSAVVQSAALFLLLAFAIGLCSVAAQVVVPLSSHLVAEDVRGRVVGQVMSGLMLGIMLARPLASFITEVFSWHGVYWVSGSLMLILAATLRVCLPPRHPQTKPSYGELLRSMLGLLRNEPQLRRRGAYQAAMFGCFSLFWTTVPLLLLGPVYGLNQGQIALFALAGVAGAVAAPLAGRAADKGWGRWGSGLAMSGAVVAFGLALMPLLVQMNKIAGLAVLVSAAIILDFCATANLIFGQRILYSLQPELRGRINGVFMATFFSGGALASAVGGWLFYHHGWVGVCAFGALLPLLALGYFLTEFKTRL